MKTTRKRPRKPIAPACPYERDESMAVMRWARHMVETNQEPRLRLLRCGFEGLRLSMGVRMQVKRQSVASGWPDLFLSVPLYDDHRGVLYCEICGLYIELKRQNGGTVSAEQKSMHKLLRDQGYRVEVCRGAVAAIDAICEYLGLATGAAQEPHDTALAETKED
jgi:hypothetical protein